jgi:hypothetical protein
MKTRRERKHPRIAVSGDLHLDRQLPPWEMELLLAALARLAERRPLGASRGDPCRAVSDGPSGSPTSA